MVALTTQQISAEIRRQQNLSTSIVALQTSISSGVKVSKSSDDPQTWVQISDIARAQSQQSSWASNVSYAQSRASAADSAMDEISTLLTRAQELMTSAGSALSDADRASISTELTGIKESIDSLMTQKDALGTYVFDQGTPTKIPVGRNLSIEVVPTASSMTTGIDVGGTSMSLDDIFSDAFAALASGDSTARGDALSALQAAGDHMNLARTVQGNRADRLDKFEESLDNSALNLEERRAAVEETDLTEAVTRLQAKALSLEAAQAAYAKISQTTLFDLIS